MKRRHRTEKNHSKKDFLKKKTFCAKTKRVLNIKNKIIYFALQEDAELNHLVTIPGALERFLLISILSRALTWDKKIMANLLYT